MKNRTENFFRLSLVIVFLTFLLSGILYFSPAYGSSEGTGENQSISQSPAVISNQDEEITGNLNENSDSSGDNTNGTGLLIHSYEITSESKESASFRKASGFDTFNARYQNQWKASFSKKTGKIRLLYGSTSKQYPDGPENVARKFLKESHSLFGMKQDLSDLRVLKVNRTSVRDHVKLQQTYNGIPIAGVFTLVHLNKANQITMVQNNYIEGFQPSNQEQLSAESAMEIARDDLRTSLGDNATFSEPKAEKLIAPFQKAYYYVWNVMISTRNPWGLWVYHVDASNGQILYKGDQIRSLSGSGSVYKSNSDYFLNKITAAPLNKLLPDPSTNNVGYLFGTHAAIYNYVSPDDPNTPPYTYSIVYDPANDPFEPSLRFNYYDTGTGTITNSPFFHAVNAYYKLNQMWDWWNQKVVPNYVNNPTYPDYPKYVPYFTDTYPIPTLVNAAGLCNAFYTPDFNGDLTLQPGFIFGDENSCSFANEDLVLDEDLVAHEFTHFMMDQCGFSAGQFDASLYGMSMGEGNADFFAFLRSKNTKMGDVAWAASPDGYLRTLDNTRMYPNDVDDPGLGGPEPHYTGQIWGGYLYDLYKVLQSQTLKYVFQGFYYFDSGFGGFAGGNHAQWAAEYDLNTKVPLSQKALGAAVSRGFNTVVRPVYPDDGPVPIIWVFPPTTSINTKANFINAGDVHEYLFEADNPGMNLTVTVSSSFLTPKITNPVISLYFVGDGSGDIPTDPVTHQAIVVHRTTVGPTSSTRTQLNWTSLTPGIYSIVVTALGTETPPGSGTFTNLTGFYTLNLSLRGKTQTTK